MIYCKEVTDEIIENIKLGMTIDDSLALAGVDNATFYTWMNDERKLDFRDKVTKAKVAAKKRCVQVVQKAAINTWQAAAWWLERKHRLEFALAVQHSGYVNFTLKDFMKKVYDENKKINGGENGNNDSGTADVESNEAAGEQDRAG